MKRDAPVAQDGVRAALVHVLDDARQLGVRLEESRHQTLGAGQALAVRHQDEQALVRGPPRAQHGMTQDAGALVLDVGGDVQPAGQPCHVVQRGAHAGGLGQAVLAGHDPVAAGLVEAAADGALAPRGEGGRRLVAEGQRLVHAHDGGELAAILVELRGEQLLNLLLLAAELDGVGDCEPLAASTRAGDRACVGSVSHGASVRREDGVCWKQPSVRLRGGSAEWKVA